MSRYIATRALRGANLIIQEFEALLQKALAEFGPDKQIQFTNTAYFLPTILGYTGRKVEKVLPCPTLLCTSMRPPWISAIRWAIARPSPSPPPSRERDLSTR